MSSHPPGHQRLDPARHKKALMARNARRISELEERVRTVGHRLERVKVVSAKYGRCYEGLDHEACPCNDAVAFGD